MSKVFIFEGLPGSGKSTFAKRLFKHFGQEKAMVYNEGDLHPIDLAWCSYVAQDTYEKLLLRFPLMKDEIKRLTTIKDGMYITAYTKANVHTSYKDYYDEFSQYEVYRYKDINSFLSVHLKLYEDFNQSYNKDKTYIFECVFLQNHINELILKHDLSENEIISYFNQLLKKLSNLEVHIIYLNHKNTEKNIEKVIEERRSEDHTDWIDLVIKYFENQPYSKEKGYIGKTGTMKYFTDRKNLEKSILDKISVNNVIIDVEQDFEIAYDKVISYVEHIKKQTIESEE